MSEGRERFEAGQMAKWLDDWTENGEGCELSEEARDELRRCVRLLARFALDSDLLTALEAILACDLSDTTEVAYFAEATYPNWPTQTHPLRRAVAQARTAIAKARGE